MIICRYKHPARYTLPLPPSEVQDHMLTISDDLGDNWQSVRDEERDIHGCQEDEVDLCAGVTKHPPGQHTDAQHIANTSGQQEDAGPPPEQKRRHERWMIIMIGGSRSQR